MKRTLSLIALLASVAAMAQTRGEEKAEDIKRAYADALISIKYVPEHKDTVDIYGVPTLKSMEAYRIVSVRTQGMMAVVLEDGECILIPKEYQGQALPGYLFNKCGYMVPLEYVVTKK